MGGQMPGKEIVSVVLTSCGRPDLLERTLSSFYEHLDFHVNDIIVYEDSGIAGINDKVKNTFRRVTFVEPVERMGQIVAQDTLWSLVKTKYVLTWEDDWETYKGGYYSQAVDILESQPKTLQVLLRHPSDNNGHPTLYGGSNYRYLSTNYHWKGFSFSPSLKRLSDYKLIGSYGKHTRFDPSHPAASEQKIGQVYYRLGFRAAILKDGFVRHIGATRHVK